MRFLLCSVLLFASISQNVAQSDGVCCDNDSPEYAFACGTPEQDNVVCDVDCSDYDGEAACIPLDGGLSLLALAGGGLATAAMRRRREEEEAAQEAA